MSVGRALLSDRALQGRVLLTLGILALVHVVSHRLLPTLPSDFVRSLKGAGMLDDAASSGVIIGALGLMPYLSASLWIQLATPLIPVFRRWRDEGRGERLLIMQIVVMLVLSLIQGWMLASVFQTVGPLGAPVLGPWGRFVSVLVFTVGSIMFLSAGLLINRYGIGNGIALLVAMTVAVQLPEAVDVLVSMAFPGAGATANFTVFQMVSVVLVIVMVFAVAVRVYTAEVKVPVTYGGVEGAAERTGYLRLPLFFCGYMPIVFGQAILMFVNPACYWLFGVGIEQLEIGKPGYYIATVVLVLVYGLVWGRVGFSPRRLALYLAEDGGRIEGCAPGRETVRFFRRTFDRLNVAGTVALVGFAVVPALMNNTFNVPFMVAQFMGGVSVLVLAAVGADFYRHLKMHARSVTTDSPAT